MKQRIESANWRTRQKKKHPEGARKEKETQKKQTHGKGAARQHEM